MPTGGATNPGPPSRPRKDTIPTHRLPFWAQDEKSHAVYMNPRRQSASPFTGNRDYGVENFSYDMDQLAPWLMPAVIARDLPAEIRAKASDLVKAGAAIVTALDRTEASYRNAMYSAFPDRSSHQLLRRQVGSVAAVGVNADALPWSPPASPLSFASASSSRSDPLEVKNKLIHDFPQTAATQQKQVIGMESPPCTPVQSCSGFGSSLTEDLGNGQLASKPALGTNGFVLPDLKAMHSQLSPLTPYMDQLTPVFHPEFDQNSWEHYLNHYEEQMRDCKVAYQRLVGYSRQLVILLMEAKMEADFANEVVLIDCEQWHAGLKPMVSKCDDRVKKLNAPKLDYVTMEWESIRSNQMGVSAGSPMWSGVLESGATELEGRPY